MIRAVGELARVAAVTALLVVIAGATTGIAALS